MGNLVNIQGYFRLDNNQLSGDFPSWVWNLEQASWIYLSYNQFSGQVPTEICNFDYERLHLGWNRFCPPYPSCILGYVVEQDISNCE